MDAIDFAIKNGYHRNNTLDFQKKTWKDFEFESFGKHIYLFGAGIGVECYFKKIKNKLALEKGGGLIDNNKEVQGLPVRLFSTCMPEDYFEESNIIDVSFLNDIPAEDCIVLITSFKHYEEIAMELRRLGVTKIFSLLCMEYIYRRDNSNYYELNEYSLREIFADNMKEYDIKKNKMFIETYYTYEGHGKAILNKITEMQSELEIVWAGKYSINHHDVQKIRYITKDSPYRLMYEFATSNILLTDGIPSCWDIKKNAQTLVQMKHWSSITLKEFYWYEYINRLSREELEVEREKYAKLDYIFVGSKFDEITCRKGFLFKGPSVYVGSPRSDVLFSNEPMLVRELYNISKQDKVLLYAPTFRLYENNWKRKWQDIDVFIDLNFTSIKKALEERFGGEWVIFLRLHPIFADKKKRIQLPDFVIDVSDYPDSEELVVVSDVMITDYSSIMFEPAFIKKPVFLLSTDREDYLSRERGFLIDYETLPFPIAESNEELVKNVKEFDYDNYVMKISEFFTKYGVNEDGHASERAARFILDLIDGKVHEGKARNKLDYAINNVI